MANPSGVTNTEEKAHIAKPESAAGWFEVRFGFDRAHLLRGTPRRRNEVVGPLRRRRQATGIASWRWHHRRRDERLRRSLLASTDRGGQSCSWSWPPSSHSGTWLWLTYDDYAQGDRPGVQHAVEEAPYDDVWDGTFQRAGMG